MNRIVVIEDDPAILRGLADNLRAESYDVMTAADGEDGYRLVRDERPDIVILDVMLPRMKGDEVCRRLRRHGLATPVLLLTAQGEERDRVNGFDAGADDYLTKPFSIRELLGRVRAILRRSEGRVDLANQKELDQARAIQQRLMPVAIPTVPGLRIAGISRPARIVGGDYFDVLALEDGGVAVCIADVCGKGLPAALMMANLQAAVRTWASQLASPRDLCARVNRMMCGNMAEHGFITFFYVVIDAARQRLTYCNAGHNAPILAGRGGSIARLDQGGGVLGVFGNWRYDESVVDLCSGDRILLFTDGITENRNTADEEFGEGRLIGLLHRHAAGDMAALTGEVIEAATRFNPEFADDLTVVAVSVD
jgi:sigma-B regulation protein RsbU (phosphoserine phosphatase)